MATNSFLYPAGFTGKNNSAVVSTFDAAIAAIEVQARDTSLKESYTSRMLGQNTISVLGKSSPQSYFRMPLHKIGRRLLPNSTLLGTSGYACGGRVEFPVRIMFNTIQTLRYSSEILTTMSSTLSEKRTYMGTTGNQQSGKICGGGRGDGTTSFFSIDKIDYSKQTVSRVGATLSSGLFNSVGGIGTKTKGLLIGYSDAATYSHSLDTLAPIAGFTNYTGASWHQGLSSKNAGYLWSRLRWNGVNDWLWNTPDNTIVKVDYASDSFTPTQLSLTPPHLHTNHSAASSSTNGYVCGGSNYVPANANLGVYWFSKDVSRFNFGAETITLLSNKLSRPVVCTTAIGSSLAMYLIGGDVSWTETSLKTIEKINFSTEAASIIGSELSYSASDHGSVSDFNPSWSY